MRNARTYRSRRQEQARQVQNRLSVLAGAIGLFMIAAGLWSLWSLDGTHMTIKAHGDALGICLLVTVAGFLGFAGALVGYESN